MAIDQTPVTTYTIFKRFVATKKIPQTWYSYMTKEPHNKLCDHNTVPLLTCDHILDAKLCCHKPDNKLCRVLRIVDPSLLLATAFLHLQALGRSMLLQVTMCCKLDVKFSIYSSILMYGVFASPGTKKINIDWVPYRMLQAWYEVQQLF